MIHKIDPSNPGNRREMTPEYERECRIALELWDQNRTAFDTTLFEGPRYESLSARIGSDKMYAFRHRSDDSMSDAEAGMIARELLRGDVGLETTIERKFAQRNAWDADIRRGH